MRNLSNPTESIAYYLTPKDFISVLAYWLVRLSPYNAPDIREALQEYDLFLSSIYPGDSRSKVTHKDLEIILSEKTLSALPAIAVLSTPRVSSGPQFDARYDNALEGSSCHPDYRHIDIAVLSQNCIRFIEAHMIEWQSQESV